MNNLLTISIKEQNDKILEILEKSSLDRQHQMQMQSEQFAFNKFKEKIKFCTETWIGFRIQEFMPLLKLSKKELFEKERNNNKYHHYIMIMDNIFKILVDLDLIYQNIKLL